MHQKFDIHTYCENYSTPPNQLLNQLERETYLKTTSPYMISGRLQGRLLSFVSQLLHPKAILEIGTFTGYASLCMAEGLSENGSIITIEVKEEIADFARRNFEKSKFAEQIKIKVGDAKKIIPTLDSKFDLVFIDAKKVDYCEYFDLVINKTNSGGIIIADNVIWYGKVMGDIKKTDKQTETLQLFNDKVLKDPRVENFILPIRDGLNVIRKK